MREMTNIKCFNPYRGLHSVGGKWLARIRPLVAQAKNWRKWHGNSGRLTTQLKVNHHVRKELVDKISWEHIMNKLQV